jgi:hypothetical protein
MFCLVTSLSFYFTDRYLASFQLKERGFSVMGNMEKSGSSSKPEKTQTYDAFKESLKPEQKAAMNRSGDAARTATQKRYEKTLSEDQRRSMYDTGNTAQNTRNPHDSGYSAS